MTKNIIVVDSQGKKCGVTYLKRAKGLVKQGRARFLAQDMLCLACPPKQNLEEPVMSEQTNEIIENKTEYETEIEYKETTENQEVKQSQQNSTPDKFSIEYCLTQLEHLAHQTDYLEQSIFELKQLDSDPFCGHKASAISDVVKSREATNQQLISFYMKMYDDLKTPAPVDTITHKVHLQEKLLKVMENTLENNEYSAKEVTDLFNGALDAIRHISD